jgi:hypothetical protein
VTAKNTLHRHQQLAPRIRLQHVSSRPISESCLHDIFILVLGQENDSCRWSRHMNAGRSFQPIKARKRNVHQDQVRFQFLGFVNCF